MYNRYIPGANGHTRIAVKEDIPSTQRTGGHTSYQQRQQKKTAHGKPESCASQDMFRNLTGALNFLGGEDKNAGIAGILKSLHLEDIDSGDILLLLIILLLVLEGDNLEMAITLGLMLLLGINEEKKDDQKV